jgi:DNA recombination protein RmuC
MPDPVSLIVGLAAGLLIGGLILFFIFNRKLLLLRTEAAVARISTERDKKQLQEKENELTRLGLELRGQQIRLGDIQAERGRFEADYDNLLEKLESKESELKAMHERMQSEFENLANRILHQSAEKLTAANQQQMQHLLNPLKDRLTTFEKKVEDTYNSEARERFHLKKEIESLMQTNLRMSEDAQNLTRALKGDSKLQGNWGELILSRILESSGLREGEEFVVQGKELKLTDTDGKRFQPDVIVNLPDKKHIVIDSKVSLTAYERFVSAPDEDRDAFLKQHLDSVTTHVRQLSAKHYQALNGLRTPDFVLLFMPLESAFSLAVQARPDLFNFAWDQKIVIVSPTTLLATLKTVASIWKMEQQNTNAVEIARQGGLLYDKFASFIEDMHKIGKQLDQANTAYTDAMNKLATGKGNLISRANRLQELGVKTKKELKE